MLNIHDLEKRWKIYKIKSFLPYVIIGISCIIIIPLAYTFYPSQQKNTPIKKQVQVIKENQVQITHMVKKTPLTKSTPAVAIAQKKQVALQPAIQTQTLQPSMNFMKNIQHQASQPQYIKQSAVKKRPVKKKPRRKIAKRKVAQEIVQDITPEIAPIKKEPKVAITIERKETQNDIFEIIKRFKKNNNPALSLFVAKKYYELGNYEQSYNYALITNQINSNIEASWLIFARSLVKLHKKDKAIHTLKAYIKVSHSSNAEILLNEITSGKFK